MTQAERDKHQQILDLLGSLPGVLDQFVLPVETTPEGYFTDENLWRMEIDVVCALTDEYYSGALACIEQQLHSPAAALTRCVLEICFRFKYLVEHQREIRDWEEWQLTQDYHLLQDFLRHDVRFAHPGGDVDLETTLQGRMADIEALLGGPPRAQKPPWRNTEQIFANLADVATLPNNRARGFRRHTIGIFSEYVHPRRFPLASESLTLAALKFAVLVTLRRAMELCRTKHLLTPEADTRAGQIMETCEHLLADRN